MNLDPKVWGMVFPELLEPPATGTRPILGFRLNMIRFIPDSQGKGGLALTSMNRRSYSWGPGRNIADCSMLGIGASDQPRHQPPAPGCSCGFYACHHLGPLQGALRRPFPPNIFVLVGVAGSGIVRIHELGWRAQFARIVAFSEELPEPTGWRFGAKLRGNKVISGDAARALETRYQVPVVPLKKLTEVMRAAGDFLEGEQ